MIDTVRFACRRLWQTRAMSAAAVACIALGAAATTTVATLVTATLVRPVPFDTPDRLVRIWFEEPGVNPRVSFSIPDIQDFQNIESFDAVLGTARVRTNARFANGTERVRGEGVSAGYFETLGVGASLGRVLQPSDHSPGAPPVVVLSHGTWLRFFGGDPGVLGRELRTEGSAYTIVGVAERPFDGTVEDDVVEFFIPVAHYEPRALITTRMSRPVWMIARLRPGETIATATAETSSVLSRLIDEHPEIYRRWQVRIEPFGENWRHSLRAGGGLMFAASALLLLIAAINVGCLLLARALARWRELAVRAAIGASRGRLVTELLVEASILVSAGGLLGLAAGPWLLETFMAMAPPGRFTLPRYVELKPDATTLLLTLGVLSAAGLVAGTVPAMLGRRVSPGDALRSGGRSTVGGRVEQRWGGWLIACETALTVVLLVAGALLVRSYGKLAATELGYDRSRIARLAVTISPNDAAPAALPDAYARLQREVSVLPGVDRAGLVYPTLPPWDGYRARFRLIGQELPRAPEGVEAGIHLVNEELLPMLGVPMVAGRNLRDSDGSATDAVAVISRSVAMLLGGPEIAVGRTIELTERSRTMPNGIVRIVGVAEDIAWDGLAEGDTRRLLGADGADARTSRYDVYVPLARYRTPVVSIGAWTRGDPSALIGTIHRRIGQLFPSSAVHWVSAMDEEVALEYAPARFYAVLLAVFSWSALMLTSIGLFALLSQAATRRSPEMGLRMALGASPRSTAALLLRGGLRPVWIGIAAGLGLAVLVGRAMQSLLYDVGGYDPTAMAATVVTLVAVAFAAAWLPARRVASVDPTVVLRSE